MALLECGVHHTLRPYSTAPSHQPLQQPECARVHTASAATEQEEELEAGGLDKEGPHASSSKGARRASSVLHRVFCCTMLHWPIPDPHQAHMHGAVAITGPA